MKENIISSLIALGLAAAVTLIIVFIMNVSAPEFPISKKGICDKSEGITKITYSHFDNRFEILCNDGSLKWAAEE